MIHSFRGKYRFLSNFYPASIDISGKIWPTSEHIYQGYKTRNETIREAIRVHPSKGLKKFVRAIPLREDWNNIKVIVMKKCLLLKFSQNFELLKKLMCTKPHKLIEGNTWHDNFWGDCACEKCKSIKGKNMLGILLMRLRDDSNKIKKRFISE